MTGQPPKTRHCASVPCARHDQRGIGLIEILVSVVLISVGFLAAASMQIQGMRFSQSAYHQSQAYFMANDIIDRMRANIDGLSDGNYDNARTNTSSLDPGCDSKACTPAEIANQDLYDWRARLHAGSGQSGFVPVLPSSDSIPAFGIIIPGNDGLYIVTITWAEQVDGVETRQSLSVNFVAEGDEPAVAAAGA